MTDDDSAGRELRTLRLVKDMSGGAIIVVDPDLLIVSATGPDLVGAGVDPDSLTGRRLDEVVAQQESPRLLEAYRSALRGEEARVEVVDAASGRLFAVEVRPLHGGDGAVVGAVARAADLSDVRAQQTHLAHVAEVQGLGVSTYAVRFGWVHDARAMALLGIDDPALAPEAIIGSVVLPDDRAQVAQQWGQVATGGGRTVLSYRVPSPGSPDDVRRIQSTIEADLGSGGLLLRVVATHVDVSAAAAASAAVERAERRAQADRVGLVRDLSAVLSRSPLTLDDIVKTVTDLAVAVLGGAAFYAGLSATGDELEMVATSHADPGGSARRTFSWADPLTRPGPGDEVVARVLSSGLPWSSGTEAWRDPVRGGPPRHLVVVPVRVHTRAIGVLGLERDGDDAPYQPGDVDLAQIMADHVAGAVASEDARSGERRERARLEAASLLLADARSQRHSLVELLSETESRERMLLAEAVHDEPIQLIAAARLRLLALVRRLAQEGARDPAAGSDWQHQLTDETERVGAILETALDRLRMLIVALTPPDLGDGLLHVVGEVAEATFRGTGTTVRCTGPETLSLTPAQQDAALRIVREALVNARHHAQATRVVVRATVDATHTVLSVEDDGVGSAQMGPRKGHLGMVSMRARAEDAGAQLSVSSTPGAGTSVVLRFPLPAG